MPDAPRTLIVINPASAGGRTERRWPDIESQLRGRGIAFELHRTTEPQQATAAVRMAIADGFRRIVSVGGDGTLNEVVNGCFGADRPEPLAEDLVLGLIPSGSGGDFRRTAGIPDVAAGVAALASGRTRPLDVGRIELPARPAPIRRHFLNIADWGVGAEVVTRVNRNPHKGGGARGSAIFLGISLQELMTFGARRVRFCLDGVEYVRDVSNLVIANGRYFGGGMRVAPSAQLDDGLLDVIVVPQLSKLRTLMSIPRIYRGTHLELEGMEQHRAAVVEIHPEDPGMRFEAEGEPLGEGPARVTCLRHALSLARP